MSRLVYTVQEAAEELRIGNSTVRERIRSGQLRSFKDGGPPSGRWRRPDGVRARASRPGRRWLSAGPSTEGSVFQDSSGRWVAMIELPRQTRWPTPAEEAPGPGLGPKPSVYCGKCGTS